jgi:leucyl aminopeptidase
VYPGIRRQEGFVHALSQAGRVVVSTGQPPRAPDLHITGAGDRMPAALAGPGTLTWSWGDVATIHVGLDRRPTVEDLRQTVVSAGEMAATALDRSTSPDGAVVMCDLHRSCTTLPADTVVELVVSALTESLSGHHGRVHLVLDGASGAGAGAEKAVRRGQIEAEAVLLARGLTDARGNELPPRLFADQARQVAARTGLASRVWDEDSLRAGGFGGLLAVGSGSSEPPRFVELRYDPDPDAARHLGETGPGLALVGKGVTFDSGGLSLKSPSAMTGMHTDKAGAAVVVAVMSALRALNVAIPVRGYLPLAENLPGAGATRPGDVVTGLSGTRIEVVDTDFEGRVLLSDALTFAARQRPAAIVDVATLTYQATIALGPQIGAVLGRGEALVERVLHAAELAGEPLWRLPLARRYRDQLRSAAPGADLRNHPGADSGRAITAALFLAEFVPGSIPWAHLDIAGPAVNAPGPDARATGFGVRTLLALVRLLAAQQATDPKDTDRMENTQ